MIAAIAFWALTGGGTLASAVYLIHQYCDGIGVWRYRRESAAERRIRQLAPLSNGRKPR